MDDMIKYVKTLNLGMTYKFNFQTEVIYSYNSQCNIEFCDINPHFINAVKQGLSEFESWAGPNNNKIEYYTDDTFTIKCNEFSLKANDSITCACTASQLLFGNPDCQLHGKVKEDIYY